MRTRSKLVMLTIAAFAGLASVAEAAPMPLAVANVAPEAPLETVQYYDGGHRYRAYQGHLRRQYAQEGHRYRAYQGHLRRQDAHYRRLDAHYRRAYRYGY